MPILSSLVLMLAAAGAQAQSSAPLPALGADAGAVSVSGLSSGAFMAVQYQVAFSASVIGAGVVAGGPYYCAAGFLGFTPTCMGKGLLPPDAGMLLSAAQGFAAQGKIDPLSGLANDRIYVFSGTKDTVVATSAVNSTVDFFKRAGVPTANLSYVNKLPAGHALVTPNFGNSCGLNQSPYISHCTVGGHSYDQPGAILSHIYGQLQPPASSRSAQVASFNQGEFADVYTTGMPPQAYVYVPAACTSQGGCKVHVAFHGCKQSAQSVNDDFYDKSSYNSWADSNKIIVLYPQVNKSYLPFNPDGCWDWFGYTGSDYALKSGLQLKAIRAMIDRLTAPLASPAVASQ
ncbi:depolymerase [Oxalobacteraceae bacterium]|nr:depolymerase [Oxalobacteraceae bacterium]